MGRRILYVEMAYGFGGSIVSLHQLVQGLNRAAYEPLVLFYRPNAYLQRFADLGIETIVLYPNAGERPARRLIPRPSSAPSALRRRLSTAARIGRQVWAHTGRLHRVMRERHVDLVHLNDMLTGNREGVIAARWANVPCVAHVRAFEQITAFDRSLMRYVDAFIYISQAIARAHEGQGAPPSRGQVIYNALDPREYAGGDRQAARAAYGLADDEQVIGITGRLVAWKGHTVFLKAIARLAQTHPRVRGLVVGDVESTEPQYRAELEALAGQLGIRERVTFTGHCADMPGLLPALDVLAHCSLQPEPFGRVFIEGMAAGVPVVGAADGAAPEIIADGETGLLVPPGDEAALARAVARLLDEPALAGKIRAAARRRVEEDFSIATHVRQVESVYRRLLG